MWWAPERKGDDEGQVWGLRKGRHGAACCYLHAQNSSSEMSAKSICWMCIRSVSLRSNHLETTRASHLYGSELGLLTRSYEQQRSCGCAREEVLAPGSGAMSGRLTLPRSPRSVLSAQGPTRGSRRGLRCSLGRGRGTKQSVRPARCTTEAVIAYPWTDVLSPVAQAPALLRSLSGQESSRWATHRTQRTQSSGPPRTLKVLRASAVCARGTPPGKTDSSCSRDLVWLRNFDWLISVSLSAWRGEDRSWWFCTHASMITAMLHNSQYLLPSTAARGCYPSSCTSRTRSWSWCSGCSSYAAATIMSLPPLSRRARRCTPAITVPHSCRTLCSGPLCSGVV